MTPIALPRAGLVLRVHDLPGTEPPLVFLHGLGCAASSDYPGVVRDPALLGRRVILVDLPGHGFSDKPTHLRYTISEHAQIVLELIAHLDLGIFDLFGHSMGGAIAIEVAAGLPQSVRHLILTEPNLDRGGGLFSRAIAAQTEADYVQAGHAAAILAARQSGNPVWAGTMAVCSPLAAYRSAVSLVQGSSRAWRELLLQLPLPRTLIFGAHSLPDTDFDTLPQHGIDVDLVARAGHSMAWDNPSGLARAIAQACAPSQA